MIMLSYFHKSVTELISDMFEDQREGVVIVKRFLGAKLTHGQINAESPLKSVLYLTSDLSHKSALISLMSPQHLLISKLINND